MSSNNEKQIRYSQCWEDADLVLKALNIRPSDTVLSIASGGENTLSILSENAMAIYAIDTNYSQTQLAKLKFKASQFLTYKQYLEFLGIRKSKQRVVYFNQLSPELDADCLGYFKENITLVKNGVIYCGKFEKYLRIFKKWILPLIQSKKTIAKLLLLSDKKSQRELYKKKWDNKKWRLAGKIFFSKTIMQKMGRHKDMFRYNPNNQVGQIYLNRVERFVLKGNIYENPYLEYILTGEYNRYLPHALSEEAFLNLKNPGEIVFSTIDIKLFLQKMPDNSLTKYNLSDIFECMSESDCDTVFREILRTAKPGARLLFWNNLVERDVPKVLEANFIRETSIEDKLRHLEKVFFYDKFYVYSVL